MDIFFKFNFIVFPKSFLKTDSKLLFVRLIKTINIGPIYIHHFDIFLINFFTFDIKEWSLEATINDIEHSLHCKELWKVLYFHLTYWPFYILSFLNSLNNDAQILLFHLSSNMKVFLTQMAAVFVLFLNLIMHIIILFHNFFNKM